jgi:rhomboid protease GluP
VRPPTPTTLLLLGTLAACFCAQLALSPAHDALDPLWLYRLGSLHEPSVEAGDFWRLGSYAFLHIGVAHFVVNAAALWVLMRPLEVSFGGSLVLGFFAAAALAGGCASALHARLSGELFLQAAGASGGIFGLFGATGAIFFRLRHQLPREALRGAMATLFADLVLNAIIAIYAPVDNYAHAGGLLAGALCALAAPHPALPPRPWHGLSRIALIGCAFALAAMGGAGAARAASPRERVLRVPGFTARAPYMLPQPSRGGQAVSAVGLLAAIVRSDEPPPDGEARLLGGRRWVSVPLQPRSKATWIRALALVAPEGAGSVEVVVHCYRRSCWNLVDSAADTIASTLTRSP